MRDDDNTIRLNRTGIILPNGDNDHVLTSNGSTINMANYLKESDVSGQFAAKADRSDLITLEQKVTANTTAITKLRTIVINLIDALSASGLIRTNSNLE